MHLESLACTYQREYERGLTTSPLQIFHLSYGDVDRTGTLKLICVIMTTFGLRSLCANANLNSAV